MESTKGYKILNSTLFEDNHGVALGCNSAATPYPFATWYFTENKGGERDYYRIHECINRSVAERDFCKRVDDYKYVYRVQEKIEGQKSCEYYRYYSTQRPVDIGTFPNPIENPVHHLANYDGDGRMLVAGGQIYAWGEVTYKKPLTEKQMDDYELKPSPDNPDRQKHMEQQTKCQRQQKPSIAARLVEGTELASKGGSARSIPEKNTDKDR